jgi:hypothetical protein
MSKVLAVFAVLGALFVFALPTSASAASKQDGVRAHADQYEFSSTYYYRRHWRPRYYPYYRPYYYGYRPYYRPYYGYGYYRRPYYGYRYYW